MHEWLLFLLAALHLVQLAGVAYGFYSLHHKVQAALNRRAISLNRLALIAAGADAVTALRHEVQILNTRLGDVERASEQLLLRTLLDIPPQPTYQMRPA